VGSRGDSYDNVLAETINGPYAAELIHRRAAWKTKEAPALATLEWVPWFNHQRLLNRLGVFPRPKLKKITIGNSEVKPLPRNDLTQQASLKLGAVHRLR